MLLASEISPGTRLAPFSIQVESAKMKTVAAIMRDPNPTHYDVKTVKALGLGERLLNQGPANAGYMMEFVCRVAGGAAEVRSFKVRYLSTVHEGDVVVCEGTVSGIDTDAETAELELLAAVEGNPVLAGSAVVALH
jgi:hypothetical protein